MDANRHAKSYQKDLNQLLNSEILGEQLFATAARLSRNLQQREKWQTLAALEAQTKRYFTDYLRQSQQHAKARQLIKLQASISRAALAFLPWKISMQLLDQGTAPFLQCFERLNQGSSPQDLAFFNYVLAHEQAIKKFAQLEQQNKPDQSLEPVLKLLAL